MLVNSVIMRGGTSRGLFFHERDLPREPAARDEVILRAMGSPDPHGRQIDGLGGATSSTSKVAVISPGTRGADVDYEFCQVSIDAAVVDRGGNCGNLSAAVGPFAVDEGLVTPGAGTTRVRIHNTNTGKIIVATVPTRDGRFDPTGDFAIPGIPGTGSRIQLDYLDPGGSRTGSLLPTGSPQETLDVPGLGEIPVTLIDAANPFVLVRWRDLGLTGRETPDELDTDVDLLARLEHARTAGAVRMGLAASREEAGATLRAVPKLALVGPPTTYQATDGTTVDAAATSLRVAALSMGQVHRALPVTAGICLAVAAGVDGTVVAEQPRPDDGGSERVIGHPSGTLAVAAEPHLTANGWTVDRVSVFRTARRLMAGQVHV
ncbi:2-methylaconitate cis-trans isomerase PrpF family protein [Actinoalloteichus caeruleus]|uniref:2-methylaconitate cis-trans isomerase PrpF family protein n=1 Tax=Actinoalloteichus cyanogriseus TaxID=2893586 RepID=UPI003AABC6D4